MVDWEAGVSFLHMGWLVVAVEEGGRQFWATTDPTPIGQTLRQEFTTFLSAVDYIDNRETEKVLFKIKYGKVG